MEHIIPVLEPAVPGTVVLIHPRSFQGQLYRGAKTYVILNVYETGAIPHKALYYGSDSIAIDAMGIGIRRLSGNSISLTVPSLVA